MSEEKVEKTKKNNKGQEVNDKNRKRIVDSKYYLSDKEQRNGLYLPIGIFITSYAREKTIRTSQAIKDYSIKKHGKDMDDVRNDVAELMKDKTTTSQITPVLTPVSNNTTYQGKGIGGNIVEKTLDIIRDYKKINSDVRVYLGASKGKEEFYKKFGFITREEAEFGKGMILNNFE